MSEITDGTTTVFICGQKPKHECDTKGPLVAGGDTVPTLYGEAAKRPGRGYTWGSVSCSICGTNAMERMMRE